MALSPLIRAVMIVFVHVTAIQASGLKQLIEDQRVEFDMQEGRNGRMVACDISILDVSSEAAAE